MRELLKIFLIVFSIFCAGNSCAEEMTPAENNDTGAEIVEAVTPPPVLVNESGWFTVLSYDAKSASFVANMGSTFARWFTAEMRWNDVLRNRPIRIELLPRFEVQWRETYRIHATGGQVTLFLRWGNDTDFEMVACGIAHAWLARIAQINDIAEPAAAPPTWLIVAFSRELTAQLKPALLDFWAREAVVAPVPLLKQFSVEEKRGHFSPVSLPDADKYGLQAFWFWRQLRREGAINTRNLVNELSKKTPLETLLAAALPDVFQNENRRALWLPVGYQQVIRDRATATMNMREAREYLLEMTLFTFAPDGEDRCFSAKDLIALRNLDAVKQAVPLRLRKLRLDIARANPIWHNAWLSYGIFLEKFSSAKDDELRKLWRDVETEIANSTALEKEIARALSEDDSAQKK